MTREQLKAELHKRLDQMIDRLEFDMDSDEAIELAELTLTSQNDKEVLSLSCHDGNYFAEFYERRTVHYHYTPETQTAVLTEADVKYYYDDGTEYSFEDASLVDYTTRVWVRRDT